MITLSIVSHRQGRLVESLLSDLARVGSRAVTSILITRNVDEPEIRVPDFLRPITVIIDNRTPLGFGANHNQAFESCTTPYFAVINPDIRLVDEPFSGLAHRLAANAFGASGTTPVVLVAPRILSPDGRDEDAARKLITPWRLIEHRVLARDRKAAQDFDWLAGMFMVVLSAAFRHVGGFDSRYFMYCEDFDLCARLRLNGWQIAQAAETSVVHAAQRASHRSLKHLRWHLSSLVRMWMSPVFWRYRHALAAVPR